MTANLYCAGRLDEVLQKVVAPFRQELRERSGEAGALWTMRYSRGGEHLKIRLHGPESCIPRARDLLEGLAEHYLAGLPGADEAPVRTAGAGQVPPIDLEDEAPDGHPDRQLVWTHYRRSHISFVGKPLLLDDTYVALAVRCLSRGCDLVLEALTDEGSRGRRQTPLLQALIGGTAALGLPAGLRSAYFAFHRDWLVRFLLVRRGAGPEKAAELTAQFDLRRQALGASLVPLREVAEEEWGGAADEGEGDVDDADAAWRSALVDLYRYVSQSPHDLDPFAEHPAFPPIFKVFHGFANQLGVNPLDEAFVHHLLLGMTLPPGTAGPAVRLVAD